MTIYGEIGSVSSGTLRNEDLLVTFADLLDEITLAVIKAGDLGLGDGELLREQFKLAEGARRLAVILEKSGDFRDDDLLIKISETLRDLIDKINEYAPPLAYFGTLEGDGADFGFWPDDIDRAASEGECLKLDELPSLIAVISDHGNVTMYEIEAREVWSVV